MALFKFGKKEDKEAKRLVEASKDENSGFDVFEQKTKKEDRKKLEEAELRRNTILDEAQKLKTKINRGLDNPIFEDRINEILKKIKDIELNNNYTAMEVIDNLIINAIRSNINLINRNALSGLTRSLGNLKQLINERFDTVDYFLNEDYLKLYKEHQKMFSKFEAEQTNRAEKVRQYNDLKAMYGTVSKSEQNSIAREAMRIEKEVAKIDSEISSIEISLDLYEEALSACRSGLSLDKSPLHNTKISALVDKMLNTSLDNKYKIDEIQKAKAEFEKSRISGEVTSVEVKENLVSPKTEEKSAFVFKDL